MLVESFGAATTSAASRTRSKCRSLYPESPPGASTDDVVRGAVYLPELGVSTLVTGAMGDDPSGWLESSRVESSFGPAMDRLAEIEPARL